MLCPYCDGPVNRGVAKCRHCGEWLQEPQRGYGGERDVVVQVQQEESILFAVITLLLYIFLYPVGLLLNVIGLLTGPRRGCFVSMLLVFIVLPIAIMVLVLGLGTADFERWKDEGIPAMEDSWEEIQRDRRR